MPPAPPIEEILRLVRAEVAGSGVGPEALWFDAHTHTGHNDPDLITATPEEIVAGLDESGHQKALVFTSADPGGYREPNDRVLAEAAASGGRLIPLARLDPHDDAIGEAHRTLELGARGFKFHPRAEQFELHHLGVEPVVALAHEHKLPIMIHAGRGIPALGRDAVMLARKYPGARLILAHAGICDLSWIWRELDDLPNLFFDTAWWNVADLVALYATVPPSHILYASDMPYGRSFITQLTLLRCGRAVGLTPEQLEWIAGRQLERLLAGEEPADLGPAPGMPTEPFPPCAPRVAQHLANAVGRAFVFADPSEPLALALLACDVPDDDPEAPLLRVAASLIEPTIKLAEGMPETRRIVAGTAIVALAFVGTPSVPVAV
jgi:predicted TIM-barrel fold metal-dependent hydrolase